MFNKSKKKQSNETVRRKPLRLWPGVVILILQLLVRFGIPEVIPGDAALNMAVLGGLFGWLLIILWWAFFSRAPRIERWGAVILMILALAVTRPLLHESIKTAGRGALFPLYATLVLSFAFVAWAMLSRKLADGLRRVTMIATIVLACGIWTLVRSNGITGEAGMDFTWRWTKTPEERLLTQLDNEPLVPPSTPLDFNTKPEWPGFRGPDRNGIARGILIETDWSTSPPEELWRKPIGPGCSSFAVYGPLFYTQEQRGKDEVVSCYDLTTGKPVWIHRDKARFWDSHAGAGPRSTPTLCDSLVYTLGATGILNVLDARDGSVVWSRNAASDTDVNIPEWGITSSPLVVDDVVIVAVVGQLVAYDLVTGDLRWSGPDGGETYSSPHLATIDSVKQVLMMSKTSATSFSPSDGTILWEHKWGDVRIVQPAMTADGDLLLSAGSAKGMSRISVTYGTDGWTIEERWSSTRLKPNFNDFTIHKGHAFGFDGPSLVCVDIESGNRKWRGGRYGGQLILLTEQDLLLVVSEKGELALIKADTERFTELARYPAVEGKTWNHPVMAGNVLLVRNTQEMAAFRLAPAGG